MTQPHLPGSTQFRYRPFGARPPNPVLEQALERAEGKYKRLNAAAMAITRPGGLLMTCSCSGAVTQAARLLPIIQVPNHPSLPCTRLRLCPV